MHGPKLEILSSSDPHSQGEHQKVIQERLGHATISITLDTYSHVTPGLQRAAALALDRELEGASEPPVSKPLAKRLVDLRGEHWQAVYLFWPAGSSEHREGEVLVPTFRA